MWLADGVGVADTDRILGITDGRRDDERSRACAEGPGRRPFREMIGFAAQRLVELGATRILLQQKRSERAHGAFS